MTLMYVTSCRFVYSFEYSLTVFFFFFNDTATTEIYTLSLHDALPISEEHRARHPRDRQARPARRRTRRGGLRRRHDPLRHEPAERGADAPAGGCGTAPLDRRHRPPHRPPARQARALSPRLRRAVPRLRGCRVPARAERPPRADGSARHARGRGAAAGR